MDTLDELLAMTTTNTPCREERTLLNVKLILIIAATVGALLYFAIASFVGRPARQDLPRPPLKILAIANIIALILAPPRRIKEHVYWDFSEFLVWGTVLEFMALFIFDYMLVSDRELHLWWDRMAREMNSWMCEAVIGLYDVLVSAMKKAFEALVDYLNSDDEDGNEAEGRRFADWDYGRIF